MLITILVDYPCDLEIDNDIFYHLAAGKVHKIELKKGTYLLNFILNGTEVIDSCDCEIADDCEMLICKEFVKYPLFHFVERSCQYPYAIEYHKKFAIWNGRYATTDAIYDDISERRCYSGEPYIVTINNKEGLVSEYGDVLLDCKYDKLIKYAVEPGNIDLFNQFLYLIHSGRKSSALTSWEKRRNITLNKNSTIKEFLDLMPIFYVSIVSIDKKMGAVGLDNEIFVPCEFDLCDFLDTSDFTGNWLSQDNENNNVYTRANTERLLFKVQKNGMWNIYEINSGLVFSHWFTEHELQSMLNPNNEDIPY